MKINRRKIGLKVAEILAYEARGNIWTSMVQGFIPMNNITPFIATFIALKFNSLPFWIPILALIFYNIICRIFWFIARVKIGNMDMRKGIWSAQQEFNQKKEELNPFNIEVRETLKNICKKLEIENKFKDLI